MADTRIRDEYLEVLHPDTGGWVRTAMILPISGGINVKLGDQNEIIQDLRANLISLVSEIVKLQTIVQSDLGGDTENLKSYLLTIQQILTQTIATTISALSTDLTQVNNKIKLLNFSPENGLLTTLNAGENHLGTIGGRTITAQATITRPNNEDSYGDRQTINSSPASLLQFTNAARKPGGTGVILSVMMISTNNPAVAGDFKLFLFNKSVVAPSDRQIFAPSDSDITEGLVAIYLFSGDYAQVCNPGELGNGNTAYGGELLVPRTVPSFKGEAVSGNLYGVLVSAGSYNPGLAETFTIKLSIGQD